MMTWENVDSTFRNFFLFQPSISSRHASVIHPSDLSCPRVLFGRTLNRLTNTNNENGDDDAHKVSECHEISHQGQQLMMQDHLHSIEGHRMMVFMPLGTGNLTYPELLPWATKYSQGFREMLNKPQRHEKRHRTSRHIGREIN